MNIGFIGSAGHWDYAKKQVNNHMVAGIAPRFKCAHHGRVPEERYLCVLGEASGGDDGAT